MQRYATETDAMHLLLQVKQQLRATGRSALLPETDGLFTGREFVGDSNNTLQLCASNVPRQTQWDLERAWDAMLPQLPTAVQPSKRAWTKLLAKVQREHIPRHRNTGFPSSRDVYGLRKVLSGLVIGTLDKNKGDSGAAVQHCTRRPYTKCTVRLRGTRSYTLQH